MTTKPRESQPPSADTEPALKIATLDEWKQARHFQVGLGTGKQVLLRTVTLDELAAIDGLPDDLVRASLIEMTPEGIPGEIARELRTAEPDALERAQKLSRDAASLRDRLVLLAVVEPPLTADDLSEIDGFDKALIADIASRQRTTDADGRLVYGNEQSIATFPEAGAVE